jgi:hypothetical protein
MISILGNDTSKDDVFSFICSDVKVFLVSDRIFWTIDL